MFSGEMVEGHARASSSLKLHTARDGRLRQDAPATMSVGCCSTWPPAGLRMVCLLACTRGLSGAGVSRTCAGNCPSQQPTMTLTKASQNHVFLSVCFNRTEWRKSEPHMRKEMSLIAAHAAWHMGEWEEMAIYVDTVDSGPGGSNNPAHLAAAASLALQHQQQHPMVGSSSANALNAAAAALSSNSSSSSRTSSGTFRLLGGPAAAAAAGGGASGGGGGAASSTGAFLRAVLCIKHDQHDLAQINIERSRGTQLRSCCLCVVLPCVQCDWFWTGARSADSAPAAACNSCLSVT